MRADPYLAATDAAWRPPESGSSLGVNDSERMAKSVGGIVGKRLTYRRTRRQQEIDNSIPF
jgi:hypothetical protein